jgi:hypothetical protein
MILSNNISSELKKQLHIKYCSKLLNIQNVYNQNVQENQYIWVYSSNFHNTWWCYDSICNRKLQLIYENYQRNQLILSENKMNNTTIKLKYKSKDNLNDILNNKLDEDEKYVIIDNNINSSDYVSFDDCDTTTSTANDVKRDITYTIHINSVDYRIDFDSMKQINMIDPWKKRSINRIHIPNELVSTTIYDIISYLKSNNVIGIAGQKF